MRNVVMVLRRGAVTLAVAAALLGPVAGFVGHALVPLPLRLAWFVVAFAAAVAPVPSFLAFVAGGVLLPVVPALAGWPNVSLMEQWALALLVTAGLRAAWRRDDAVPAPSRWAGVLAALVTASAVVAVAPLTVAHGGALELAGKAALFLRAEYVTGSSQRHVLASVASWAVVIEGLAMFWLARRMVAQVGRAPVLATLAGAATAVAAFGIWQWWTGAHLLAFWRQYDPHLRRINATFTDVNALGAFLAMLTPAVLWLSGAASSSARRVAWLLGGAALLAANVFTASRIAWVAAVVGVLTLASTAFQQGLVVVRAERLAHLRRAAWAAGIAAVVLLGGLTAWGTVRDVRVVTQRSYLDPVLATLNMRAPLAERLKGRLAFWDAGVSMVAQRPLDGIGIGRFFKDVSRYATNPEALPRQQENAHNYFLQLAAEAGLPALVVLLAAWGAALRRAQADAGDGRLAGTERWAAAAAAAGLIGFAVTCLTGHSLLLREGQFVTWIVVAVALGPPRGGAVASGRWRGAAAWTAIVLSIVSVVPRARAAIDAVDLTRVFEGLYDEEVFGDGRVVRWTEAEAVFHVPASAISVTFTVRGLAPVPQRLDVAIDGRDVDRLSLDDHNWRVVRYMLPARRTSPYRPIRLRIAPTWRAPGDARDLGVMLSGVEWTLPVAPP
ncbi:MAG: O-antigen ligase family protein [Acidobacteria bacterium]|nr:O-antigen ligase family protein [Acidobacteriota bacterium]